MKSLFKFKAMMACSFMLAAGQSLFARPNIAGEIRIMAVAMAHAVNVDSPPEGLPALNAKLGEAVGEFERLATDDGLEDMFFPTLRVVFNVSTSEGANTLLDQIAVSTFGSDGVEGVPEEAKPAMMRLGRLLLLGLPQDQAKVDEMRAFQPDSLVLFFCAASVVCAMLHVEVFSHSKKECQVPPNFDALFGMMGVEVPEDDIKTSAICTTWEGLLAVGAPAVPGGVDPKNLFARAMIAAGRAVPDPNASGDGGFSGAPEDAGTPPKSKQAWWHPSRCCKILAGLLTWGEGHDKTE